MTWDEPDDGDDDFAHLRDLVPDEAIPEAGLRIVSFVRPDGVMTWSYQAAGSTKNIPVLVALIEMAKFHILTGQDGTGGGSET